MLHDQHIGNALPTAFLKGSETADEPSKSMQAMAFLNEKSGVEIAVATNVLVDVGDIVTITS